MTDTKVSIRFFEDREVRAIWDDENSKWWFSVLDIVGVLKTAITEDFINRMCEALEDAPYDLPIPEE